MALINCWECGKQISDSANACPDCGASVTKQYFNKQTDYKTNDKNIFAEAYNIAIKATLREQIAATALLWFAIIGGYFIFKIYPNEAATYTFYTIAFLSLFKALPSAASFYKKQENKMSASDTIAHGVSKAHSPAAYGLGQLIGYVLFWIFWISVFCLLFISSGLLAVIMTFYVIYKLVKSKN